MHLPPNVSRAVLSCRRALIVRSRFPPWLSITLRSYNVTDSKNSFGKCLCSLSLAAITARQQHQT